MAEADNVGYKRTKRGENSMPNDLFDLEYAPSQLSTTNIIEVYNNALKILNDQLEEIEKELTILDKKIKEKETKTLVEKTEKLKVDIEALNVKIDNTNAEKLQVIEILETYYDNNKLKDEYTERTDLALINHFKNGLLSRYKSDDITLREKELNTILDNIRKQLIWE